MNTTKLLVIALTLATALIHLIALGIPYGDVLFILNGLGYLGLLAGLYFVPQLAGMRGLIRYGLMAFAAVTIVAYFVMNPDPFGSVFGLITKAIELALIVVLWLDRPTGVVA